LIELMKLIRQLIMMCAFIGSLCGVSLAFAENSADSANSVDATAAKQKDTNCTKCHDESEAKPILSLYQTKHGVRTDSRTPNCQSCHGLSDKHLHGDPNVKGRASPDIIFGTRSSSSAFYPASDAQKQNEVCLSCHKKDAKRSQWEGSTHQRENVPCAACHSIHNNGYDAVRDKRAQPEVCFKCHKEQRSQINKPSHHPIPEGKMACSDCHNPHGSVGPKLMKRDSVNETCYTCHMEKRGPFVHNHEPVDDDCTNCHNPHGTTAESMLKMRAPFLCYSCHEPHGIVQPSLAGQVASPVTYGSGSTITQGRACMNCHTEVHGSNNPSTAPANGQFFFR
jgi:DmsE family decaheme c-type cytochrome